jgi:hypothetical protein
MNEHERSHRDDGKAVDDDKDVRKVGEHIHDDASLPGGDSPRRVGPRRALPNSPDLGK